MLIKKNYFSPEKLRSRIKLDNRQYEIINSMRKNNSRSHKDHYIISQNTGRKINVSNSTNIPVNKSNFLLKDKMPYIPNKERQKAESNFISLIKALANSKNNKNVNDKNYFRKQKIIPYKPKGYNCYEYIRMNPIIINEDEENIYSKIVNDLHKKGQNNNSYNNQSNENDKIFDNTYKNLKIENISTDENKNKRLNNPLISKSYKYLNTISSHNFSFDYEDLSKSDRINLQTFDNDNNINFNNLLPIIKDKSNNPKLNSHTKQKDYKKSDIFYLINDDLSKNKSSEKYLFKKNYMPPKIEKKQKTNINEVGWSPKSQRNKSRIGCSSVAFNILSPSLKSFSPLKKDIDLLNKNNFEKAPLMSEYIDMCKPGEINLRQEFTDKFNENKNVFHKKNFCAAYGDLYHEYKDLVNNIF